MVAKQLMAHPELRSGVFSGVSTAVNAWRLCAVHRVMGYPLVAGVSMTHGVLVSDWWRSMKAPTAGTFALLLLSTFGYGYLRQVGREREKEQRQTQRELWEAKERAEVTDRGSTGRFAGFGLDLPGCHRKATANHRTAQSSAVYRATPSRDRWRRSGSRIG